LYFFKHGLESDTIQVIDPKTLKVENELQIPGEKGGCKDSSFFLSIHNYVIMVVIIVYNIVVDDSLGSQSLFVTGDKLGQIRATKEVHTVCV